MLGLMMNCPLTVPSILEYAGLYHSDREVVARTVEGSIHRYRYRDALVRAKRMANALIAMGVKPGDRVATLAWSTHRHFELYYAVAGIGAVLHTINPRLHIDQIIWIANHAEDRLLFYDLTFAEQAAALRADAPRITDFIVLTSRAHLPTESEHQTHVYEDLIEENTSDFDWPVLDERQASALCYTSGTTGNPKGVLYSHRSTVLHALGAVAPDCFNLSAHDVILPCAQMYHANAWGTPYAAPLVGAKLVFPGRSLDGASICELIFTESVSFLLGVPKIWLGVLEHLRRTRERPTSVRTVAVGGAAPSAALLRQIEETLDTSVRHLWGMTEVSPLGVVNTPLPVLVEGDSDATKRKLKQGRGAWGVELRIVGERGELLPRDGRTSGALQVRGPWVSSAYFKSDGANAYTQDGWFDTGDIATLDPKGYLQLVDRAKDIIKSGGE
jgi:acyl-CoA synthetase (AMP-forming)/AMP-acid ligase II